MKKLLIFIGVLLVAIIGVLFYLRFYYTKSFSPESNLEYKKGDLRIHIFYNRPSKKGREIFGHLVPYGQVWRTGANEATLFETNKDLDFHGQRLKAGAYSLWTIPDEQSWQVIFNTETGQWGIDFNGEANRDPARDVLTLPAPAMVQSKEFEQFTISMEEMGGDIEMILMWDKTVVAVPLGIIQ